MRAFRKTLALSIVAGLMAGAVTGCIINEVNPNTGTTPLEDAMNVGGKTAVQSAMRGDWLGAIVGGGTGLVTTLMTSCAAIWAQRRGTRRLDEMKNGVELFRNDPHVVESAKTGFDPMALLESCLSRTMNRDTKNAVRALKDNTPVDDLLKLAADLLRKKEPGGG